MIPPRRDPVAELAEAVGKALLVFAERLRAEPEPTAEPEAEEGGSPNRAKLGGTQARILEVLSTAGPAGLTSGQVADQTGIAPSNAPRALKALRVRGLVSSSDDTPVLWRTTGEAQ